MELPSHSPRVIRTGESTFFGSTSGRLTAMSTYVPLGTLSPYCISLLISASTMVGL